MNRLDLRALACALVLCSPAFADRVVTEDGRIIEVKKAREKDGGYVLEFEYGTIILASKDGVKAVEIEGDMSEYVPKDDDEKKKLEQGYIRYRGKWWSKTGYQNQLRKEHEASVELASDMAAHSDFYSGWKKETKHFRFTTNSSPELLEYYADLLEAYYKLMDNRVGINPTPSMRKKKLDVNIYKNRAEFTELTGMDPGVAGFFDPGELSLNFYHDYDEPASSDWVALHECTHLLTFLIDQQFAPQIWINEAVADYFGSSTITADKRGKLTIVPGKVQTDRVLTVQQALRDKKAIRLKDLFFIEREAFQAFEYAHAWSFVYFLNNADKGKRSKKFAKFFTMLYTTAKGVTYHYEGSRKVVKPEDIRDLLMKKIGEKDVDKLEAEWHEFIRDLPIDGPEARLKRGLRYVRMWEFGDALTDLNSAIEGGILDARAFWARARASSMPGGIGRKPKSAGSVVKSRSERMKQALADIEKAVELDPLNAMYRYEYSHLLIGQSAVISIGKRADKENSPAAKAQAGLAMALNPDNLNYKEWFESFE
jgi:hypothetical protein